MFQLQRHLQHIPKTPTEASHNYNSFHHVNHWTSWSFIKNKLKIFCLKKKLTWNPCRLLLWCVSAVITEFVQIISRKNAHGSEAPITKLKKKGNWCWELLFKNWFTFGVKKRVEKGSNRYFILSSRKSFI